MKPIQQRYTIKNLGCANCAAKMEQALRKDGRFSSASINFVNSTLQLSYDSDAFPSEEDAFALANSYVQKYEHEAYLVNETIPATPNRSLCSDGNCCGHEHGSVHTHEHGHVHGDEPAGEHGSGHSHSHGASDHSAKGLLRTILPWVLGSILGFGSILLVEHETLQFILVLIGYLLIGYKVLRNSIINISHGSIFDENFLMIVATIGALYIREYPEALLVLLLFQIGEFLQDLAVDRSKKNLAEAMNLKPQFATIEVGESLVQTAPEEVQIGDILVIKASEKVALDGIVLEGTSFLDTSSLTGESVPRKVSPGDEILSGCINGEQTLKVKVTKLYTESTIAKVLDLVQNASNRKSVTENFITKFARIYTPVVVLLALLIAILPPILTGSYDFSPWIYTACGFLVVSCPCALVISVPLGFFAGIGSSSKNGIIVKGSNYLEALTHLSTVVFDKTGTLTKGTFEVKDIICLSEDSSKEEVLYHAALLESFSTHPIARSIVTAYNSKSNEPLQTSIVLEYKEVSGHGVEATIDGVRYYLGNARYMHAMSISNVPDSIETIGTIAYLAKNNTCLGYLLISDEIKEDAHSTIEALHRSGIETVLLTGDTLSVAEKVASSLGVSKFYADLLPTDKVSKLEELMNQKSSKSTIAFVGDGINDAPVIARADIGFAMGGVGSDAAIEAADIVLMTDEPAKIARAFQIANYTRKIVIMNIVLSLGIKAIVLLVLAFGFGSMWLAIFADVGVSLIAILNSMRVLKQ